MPLPTEHFCEHEWRNDSCVRLDDVFRSLNAQFAPCNFLVGNGAGIRSEACGRITNLAEIPPLGNERADHVLIEHGHNANRKIARNAAADLKKADGRLP